MGTIQDVVLLILCVHVRVSLYKTPKTAYLNPVERRTYTTTRRASNRASNHASNNNVRIKNNKKNKKYRNKYNNNKNRTQSEHQ
jgi:hypothetical protein